jgi:tripartite ATP-independent transporter DctM subunit
LARVAEGAARWSAAALLLVVVAALALNMIARTAALPVVGAGTVAQWAFAVLAFVALPALVKGRAGVAGLATRCVGAFVAATLLAGLLGAAERLGGTEPVLGWPSAWRFQAAAILAAGGLVAAGLARPAGALAAAAGALLAFAPLPPLSFAAGIAVFATALALRVPVALALLAGVAVAPGPLSDAALAQTVMRGLSPYVLLAVPLFVFAAALMVAGGIGERIVVAARWLARARRSALGEANVLTSLLFGGVSGSSIADAAMGARLLVPAMVAAGYPPARAAGVTAASAILPNVLPPSIALLLAAAATDLSVGALWLAGIGAGFALTGALWIAVRLTPPEEGADAPADAPSAGEALRGLLPPLGIAAAVLSGLRLGLVTAVEAGLLAILIAGVFAWRAKGLAALGAAVPEAAVQTARVALLIGAAAPVGFLFATSGVGVGDVLPDASGTVVLLAAAALCLLLGMALDVGAAILLALPVLVPAAVAAGADPVHAALVLSVALLVGGLTPPVGMLVLVVQDVTGAGGVYRAVLPYLLALVAALGILIAVPGISMGLVRLL